MGGLQVVTQKSRLSTPDRCFCILLAYLGTTLYRSWRCNHELAMNWIVHTMPLFSNYNHGIINRDTSANAIVFPTLIYG